MSRKPEHLNRDFLEKKLAQSFQLLMALLKILYFLSQKAWQYDEVRFLCKLTATVVILTVALMGEVGAVHEGVQFASPTGHADENQPYIEGEFHSQYLNEQARSGNTHHILEQLLNASEFYDGPNFLETLVTTRSLTEPIDSASVKGIFEYLLKIPVPPDYFFRVISLFQIENTQFQLKVNSEFPVPQFFSYDPHLLRENLLVEAQAAIDGYQQVSQDTQTNDHTVQVEIFRDSEWKKLRLVDPTNLEPFTWPTGVRIDLSFQGEYEMELSDSWSTYPDNSPPQRERRYRISLSNSEQHISLPDSQVNRVAVLEITEIVYFMADGSVEISYGFYGFYTNEKFIDWPMISITPEADPTSQRLFNEMAAFFEMAQ